MKGWYWGFWLRGKGRGGGFSLFLGVVLGRKGEKGRGGGGEG